jgi:hypothetical protein
MTLFIHPPTMTYPVTVYWLRTWNPDTSYPDEPAAADFVAAGCEPVTPTEAPAPPDGYRAMEGLPEQNPVEGNWQQTWTVEQVPPPPVPEPVELPAPPEGPMDAATKQYVDDSVAALARRLGV